jgi:hypothetical protein
LTVWGEARIKGIAYWDKGYAIVNLLTGNIEMAAGPLTQKHQVKGIIIEAQAQPSVYILIAGRWRLTP